MTKTNFFLMFIFLFLETFGISNIAHSQCESRGFVNALCFGVDPAPGNDDTDSLQKAIDAGSVEKPVFIPAGIYDISRPLVFVNVKVFGVYHFSSNPIYYNDPDQKPGTIIRVADGLTLLLDYMAKIANGRVQLENLVFDANRKAKIGLYLYKVGSPITAIRNVTAQNAIEIGFYIRESQVANFESLVAEHNQSAGFFIRGSNASRFFNLASRYNCGTGIIIKGVNAPLEAWEEALAQLQNPPQMNTSSGGIYIINANVESNQGHGVVVHGTTSPVILENFWLEANAGEGHPGGPLPLESVLIDSSFHVNLRNLRTSCYGFTDTKENIKNFIIRLTRGSSNNLIESSAAAVGKREANLTSSGVRGCTNIQIDPGCMMNRIIGNFYTGQNDTEHLGVNFTDRNTIEQKAVAYGSCPPTSGLWLQGDIVWNTRPKPGSPVGWVCIKSGGNRNSTGHIVRAEWASIAIIR